MRLLLIHHPLDCPICDKAGECDLQDVAYEYGKPEGRFISHRKAAPSDVQRPFVELTANRCILCGKCVQDLRRTPGTGRAGTDRKRVFDCCAAGLRRDTSNAIIAVNASISVLPERCCSKPMKFQARAWFLEEKDTICPFCGCGCTLTLGMREGKILRSRAKEDSGRSDGNLCGRGRFGFDYIYSENRLKTPLIRKDGELVPVTWDEALTYISDSLKYIIKSYGKDAVGAIGSHRCTIEDNYMLRKFMVNVIGSHNMDSSAAFGYAKVQKALEKAFGTKAHPINLKSPLGKEVILVIESDISITHPVFGLNFMQAKRDGSKLIVADSRETKLTRHSSSHLKMRPGHLCRVS